MTKTVHIVGAGLAGLSAALKISITLQNDLRDALLDRLEDVRSISHSLGYRVVDEMNILLADYKYDF
jgi:flavin-dependent dehydrogenase